MWFAFGFPSSISWGSNQQLHLLISVDSHLNRRQEISPGGIPKVVSPTAPENPGTHRTLPKSCPKAPQSLPCRDPIASSCWGKTSQSRCGRQTRAPSSLGPSSTPCRQTPAGSTTCETWGSLNKKDACMDGHCWAKTGGIGH